MWGGWWVSNSRPLESQSSALTNWATPTKMVRLKGFEPLTHALEGRCSSSWATDACWNIIYSGAGDGNRTHATSLEGWGSTIELHPHFPYGQRFHMIAQIFFIVNNFSTIFYSFFNFFTVFTLLFLQIRIFFVCFDVFPPSFSKRLCKKFIF